MSETPATPYLSLTLAETGTTLTWNSGQEFIAWLSNLQNQWSWLNQHGISGSSRAWDALVSQVHNCRSLIEQAMQYESQGQRDHAAGNLRNAANRMQGWFNSFPWLVSKSSKLEFIERLKGEGRWRVACVVAAIYFGQNVNDANYMQDVVEGVLELQLFERGYKDRSKQERLALEKLATEFSMRLSKSSEFEREMVERFHALDAEVVERFRILDADVVEKTTSNQSSFEAAEEERSGAWDQAQSDRNAAWEKELADARSRLETLEKTYHVHMSLEAPVHYWTKKRERHAKWALGSGIASAVTMVLLGWLLFWKVGKVGDVVAQNAALADAAAKVAKAGASAPAAVEALSSSWHFEVAALVLIATLSFWFIRLVVRVFLSHLHLENDAAERVTMAETYLALISQNKLPAGEDLKTVLAALFRPSGDGIVKDEGLPPSMVDFMTKLR
ncbi:DUF6161 domain-containing protein [Uliginosibacterium sp. 31-16]|uniref:DUF6161 domain-containing protein n=1 Tax=Uliginosibacterium sp. 31-16 TaxID=3068315 RepID=UPI00273D2E3D|nr:DUF6161 domain-containing protein [Uliginosibacterium sp. 31-16]MDP5239119.1 DUF6161 domain-containing protein [Uliginosibacterium sp. 31-16]